MRATLRGPRVVLPPTLLAKTIKATADLPGGQDIQVQVKGMNPCVVVAIALWVTRDGDEFGPYRAYGNDNFSGVSYAMFSAINGADNDLHVLAPVPGFENRIIRPEVAWVNGVLQQGDSAEISSCLDVVLAIHHASIWGTVASDQNQKLWISVLAFPSDALREGPLSVEDAEAYRGLLEEVQAIVPSPISVPCQSYGG
jgi:hypothetical protein